MIDGVQENFEEQEENSELFEHFRFVADKGQGLLRIDKFLQIRVENASRSKIQAAAENGSILVNDKPVKANYRVKPGDVISVVLEYPPREIEIIPEDISIEVIYEDDYLVVVNKPAGLVVHPSYGHYTGTLINALAYRYKDLPIFNGSDARPGLIHRIDKDTSGLLVIAKTEAAKTHIALQFFEHTTHRRYVALVWGSFDEEEGTITGHVGRSLKNRKVMDVFPDGEYGKHAITHYKVLERLGYITLIECRLETGRTHQIRAHMKYLGHPLFNDPEYGGDQILKGTTFTKYKQFVQNCFALLPRQALHAKELGFRHPKTNQFVQFDSPIPDDMTSVINKWRNYISDRNNQ
ncbi:MAG: RNA pseudouridine synthase [Bacteroidetes bacterium GWE2_40_63]|jgi:23S rRNA pseudouridine1911/1915/1917 synthase|nr:MAG: RNA pseudouridine synthase [Bacteroidetes bacterium GWA2_40_14]OFX57008.1 MAG: RNA pseudouridine synthase [Bacteroidetes bacterium GWC2_40_13]OFX74881.1 MAG: RNA pseudouridine synthase [Bacteroidetes bacterium GWD2_40_43]OFX93424.1 MAG: RNA pseudouridine synthase [Bacteroidetes bacterium GWE2_40_63]OFY18437.1 MAG: RNA pseudouridine synthase [Bacteroidetes bacterium GWF2_40_13]OFZ26437.1 MAG: RNA pseudouridine synthase [Bacteroidetes bacterium RIFOXYC2_FULL_40_12]HBY53453.1 RNA pseudou